jgi:hypothetical protein
VTHVERRIDMFVVGRWESREAADAALRYRTSPNVQRVESLVSGPRRRTVGRAIDAAAGSTR